MLFASSTPTDAGSLREDGTKGGCVFCDVSVEKGFRVVWENDEFIIFRDRSPGSRVHLLALPRRHVDNVKTLRAEDAGMVQRMKQVGQEVLLREGVPEGEQRLGFHIPPFFSVNHLHLHLLSLPLPFPGSWKYRPSFGHSPLSSSSSPIGGTARCIGGGAGNVKLKGFSWFAEVDQVIAILQAGKRVKVGSLWSGAEVVERKDTAERMV
ncbi:hypothetical protein JCM10213_006197 [Rhodosporidiobolus nylandii]